MKYPFFYIALFTLISCNSKDYKYKIYNPNYLSYNKPAYFFTDTIQWKCDTAYYINSDNSTVIISIDSLKDCKIDTLK